jgi:hypothetical protein
VIAFALVAIIGILPTGMSVQKDNRQETIVNQDASIFLEAIRNGAQGVDDLTNYVTAITNYWTLFPSGASHHDGYTYTVSETDGTPFPQPFYLLSGNRIVGLLSTPKYTQITNAGASSSCRSNYVVAYVRAISGGAAEKYPQTNANVIDGSFSYRLVSEVVPYAYYDPLWVYYDDPLLTNAPVSPAAQAEIDNRRRTFQIVVNQQTNLYDLRLLFRWPLFNNGNTGPQRQVFRTITGGYLLNTNDGGTGPQILYLFQPRTYKKAT